MTHVHFLYECEGEFIKPTGLDIETRTAIKIDTEELTKEIAVVAFIINDIEKAVMEKYRLSRNDYESIRSQVITHHE
jgi:hypothetical protein